MRSSISLVVGSKPCACLHTGKLNPSSLTLLQPFYKQKEALLRLSLKRHYCTIRFKGKALQQQFKVQLKSALNLSESKTGTRSSSQCYSTQAVSTLFTSRFDSEASSNYKSPVQIDLNLDVRLMPENVEALRKNLSARRQNLDFDQLLTDYREWKTIDQRKTTLEVERTRIAKAMAALVKDKVNCDHKAEKIKLTEMGKAVKEELHDIAPKLWTLEERVMMQALHLPTDLHHTVLEQDRHVEVSAGALKREGDFQSHIHIAEKLGLIKFSNVGPKVVYLLGDLARAELSLMHYATARIRKHGYLPVAGSEIFRTIVAEGCGIDPAKGNQIMRLHQKEADKNDFNNYYLKGNSVMSYAAFFAKMQLEKKNLPVQMCSVGRHYKATSDINLSGLYGALQSNRVTMFAACETREETHSLHDRMVSAAWDTILTLGLPARKTAVCARALAPSEGLKTVISIWAPSLQDYVEVGHVSIHNDYISQRLMSRVLPKGSLLQMVSGVAADSAVILASLLEHRSSKESNELALDIPCL